MFRGCTQSCEFVSFIDSTGAAVVRFEGQAVTDRVTELSGGGFIFSGLGSK